jgi:hypothetical protein
MEIGALFNNPPLKAPISSLSARTPTWPFRLRMGIALTPNKPKQPFMKPHHCQGDLLAVDQQRLPDRLDLLRTELRRGESGHD